MKCELLEKEELLNISNSRSRKATDATLADSNEDDSEEREKIDLDTTFFNHSLPQEKAKIQNISSEISEGSNLKSEPIVDSRVL